ncbi:MAG: TspO/MBR family protein [Burkholderiales bacterium]
MASFLVFAAAVFAAAASGGLFRPDDWYKSLAKPSWNPPSWVFAPVWTVLYIGIAFAGWLVWHDAGESRNVLMALWVAQLLLNAAWSWLFFGRHRIDLALADVSAMAVVIAAFIAIASRSVPIAAWLFVPYLAWGSFALVLNATILKLNGGRGPLAQDAHPNGKQANAPPARDTVARRS